MAKQKERNIFEELTGSIIKIGKTSITKLNPVTGKTCGIFRNIQTWDTLQFRDKVDWNMKWKNELPSKFDDMFLYDGQWYFVINTQAIEIYQHIPEELQRYEEHIKSLEKIGVQFIKVLAIK
jgi:hypothetical protein